MKRKFTFLMAAFMLLAFLAVPMGMRGQTYTQVTELDLTTKAYGTTLYNSNLDYISNDHTWNIVYGANNNKGWDYFKMGGKSATLSDYNPCYIYNKTAIAEQVDKVTVHLPAGSLPKAGMSVNSWGLYVYSNSAMTTQVDYVAGGTITNAEGSFDFTPSTGITWAANYYYKVSWDLANTTTTNGIVYVDRITLYKENTSVQTSNVAMASVDNVDLSATYSGGTITEGNDADINQGDQVTLAYTNVTTGYIFSSWVITKQDDSSNVTAAVLSGSTLTVPAYDINISATVSQAQQYTITFEPGSGTCGTSSQTYYEGTVITDFPTATPSTACVEAGYTFDGWATASVNEGSTSYTKLTSYTVTSAATLYAVYKLTEGGVSFDGTTGGDFLIYADVSGTNYYATGTISNSAITSTTTLEDAGTFTFEKLSNGNFTIKYGNSYISATSNSVSISSSNTACEWTISAGSNGGSWHVAIPNASRGLIYRASTYNVFKNYASVDGSEYFDIEIGGGSTTYFNSTPSCKEPLSAPVVSVTAGVGSITPTWGNVANANSYMLQYATSNTFATYTEVSPATSGTPITGISNGTTYYVRVKAIPSSGSNYSESAWSNEASATPEGVPTPTFSVAGISTGTANEYVDVAEVTITAPNHDDYLIYYTTDGSDPDGDAELYEGGTIDIITTGTKTIKAIAYDGDLNESEIGSITINIVASTPIGTVYAADDDDTYYYITEGIVTYKRNNNNMFIEDDDAGILVYGTNSSYAVGDRVAIKGTKSTYQTKPELKNITILGKFSSGNTLPLHAISISDADDYMYRRVKFTQVLVGSTSDNLTTISQGADNIAIYYMPSVTNVTDEGYYLKTITGIVAYYDANQMYVASADDITSYTIDATSNNTTLGTVTTSGYVVTATPASGVVYDDPAYVEVTDATVYNISQTGNVFTIVTNGDMDIEIQFATAATLHEVTFSVNGAVDGTLTRQVVDGNELGTLPTATAPNGYVFMGWTESTISGVQAGAPTMVASSTTVNDDMDLYAVFALVSESNVAYEIVAANVSNIVDGTYLIAVNKVNSANYNFANGSAGSGHAGVEETGVAVANSYLPAEIPEGAKEYTLSGNNTDGFSIHCSTGYLNGGSTKSSLSYGNSATETWTFSVKNDGFVLDGVTNESKMSCNSATAASAIRNYASTGNYYDPLYFFKKNVAANYSNYCTTVTILSGNIATATHPGACAIDETAGVLIESGVVLTAGALGNSDPDNLLIEEGGQLVVNNAVSGTMYKSVSHYTDVKDNYYLIASPVDNFVPAGDMIDNSFDLYYFDESQAQEEWQNYEANTFNLEIGKGYLYANNTDTDLEFAGELTYTIDPIDLANTSSNPFAGWNLIGNPYPCRVTINAPFYRISGNALATEATANTVAIEPMEAVFVQYDAANSITSITFTKAPGTAVKGNRNALNIMTRDNARQTTDNALICFGTGNNLHKFTLNPENAMVYIPQHGEEFAIVDSEARGEMPVNFKAAENGTYTISVEAENLDVNYLHLIDNITGMDVDLLTTPSYTFEGKRTDYASRFRLVFDANAGNNEANEEFAFISDGNIIVNGTGTVQVIDILGRQMFSHEVNSAFRIQNSEFAPGVYVLRLINGNNVKTQKIVVK